MKKKAVEESDEPTAPFWMTTYGDMVTLMLTFFILLISYSTIELEKFRGAMESLRGALGVFSGHESPQKSEYINFNSSSTANRSDLQNRAEELEEFVMSQNLGEMVSFEITEGGVLLRFGQEVLFDVGSADLKDEAYDILSALTTLIEDDLRELFVEGHTDNVPINTSRFPSNWELSAARALSVVRYFHYEKHIPEKNLIAVGRGEHRPIVPNNSAENRAKNRRVEIYIRWGDVY